jgi:N4-(beta-N-acetylglucosaminyl)-L-asparaginase
MTDPKSPTTRRSFLAASAAGLVAAPGLAAANAQTTDLELPTPGQFPVLAISSANGLRATERAFRGITEGADVLDACIAGVNIVEDDPEDLSVGYGGLPNEDGVVQLDAAVMHGPTHLAGAVAALQRIRFPSRVAQLVMQQTDHVLLVGEGALRFAKAHGFPEEDLLTEKARKTWLRWKQSLSDHDDWLLPDEQPQPPAEPKSPEDQVGTMLDNRPTGTIHCAGMDANGDISCLTSTSGLAFKIPGRVGDSPIVGAGLYVDNNIGSCGSTGRGEANLQNLCSFAAVELMGRGMTPVEAGLEVLRRVARHTVPRLLDDKGRPAFGLKFYLIRKDGQYAAVSMHAGSQFAVSDAQGTRLEPCTPLFDEPEEPSS